MEEAGESRTVVLSDDWKPEVKVDVGEWEGGWQMPLRDGSNAWRRATLVDGRTVRVYENGAVAQVEPGHVWIAPGNNGINSTERAQELAGLRHEKARQAAVSGLVAALEEKLLEEGGKLPAEVTREGAGYLAWQAVVQSRAKLAMGNTGRDGTDAARAVGKWTGMTEGEGGGGRDGGEDVIRIEVIGRRAIEALRSVAHGGEE